MTVVSPHLGQATVRGGVAGRETPDLESSTDRYAQRFAGRAGAYLLDVQTRALLRMLKAFPGATVLDVGGGHAQVAAPLAERGHRVTILGSHERCHERPNRLLGPGRVACVTGDLLSLPFPDRSFDVVASFRILPHVSDWRRLVDELCRVARTAVIVDYPTPEGWNALSPVLFKAKKRFEGDTRTFGLIRRREVRERFRVRGFGRTTSYAQFFFPMVAHRALRAPGVSRVLEAAPRAVGLTRLWGSPVITLAVRDTPSVGGGAEGQRR